MRQMRVAALPAIWSIEAGGARYRKIAEKPYSNKKNRSIMPQQS
jgi:hypothetical protein